MKILSITHHQAIPDVYYFLQLNTPSYFSFHNNKITFSHMSSKLSVLAKYSLDKCVIGISSILYKYRWNKMEEERETHSHYIHTKQWSGTY